MFSMFVGNDLSSKKNLLFIKFFVKLLLSNLTYIHP